MVEDNVVNNAALFQKWQSAMEGSMYELQEEMIENKRKLVKSMNDQLKQNLCRGILGCVTGNIGNLINPNNLNLSGSLVPSRCYGSNTACVDGAGTPSRNSIDLREKLQ